MSDRKFIQNNYCQNFKANILLNQRGIKMNMQTHTTKETCRKSREKV